ncbi:MAG: hypothetical protein ACOYPR_14375 [Saprospiraceae bacterium]
MTTTHFIQHIRQLIADNQLPAALGNMRLFAAKTPLLNDVLQQSGRLAHIRQQNNLGLVTFDEATLEQNRIRYGLLELLNDLERNSAPHQPFDELLAAVEQESARPEVQAEVANAINIVNSKNVVAGSTVSAGGNVHIGDVVYQTAPAPSAAAAPTKPLNEHLSKVLIAAICPHNPTAIRFLERAETIPNWETNAQASNKAKEILAYSFVGVIGIQLSKLFAIGKEDFSETTQNKFIEKCIQIAKRSLDLVTFALVSQIWESQKTTPRTFSANQTRALQHFFDRPFEPDIAEQVGFFQTLCALFAEHGLPFPFLQLQDFGPHFQPGSVFQKAIGQLQALNARLDQKSCLPADCTAAEQALAEVLTALHFLAACRMASMKRIGYWQIRTAEPKFLHRYAALGIDSKANVDAEKINFTTDTAPTDSVLLHRGDAYQESLNLSPFIIDFNALTYESGAKICFFRARALADDSLEFTFLEDNSPVNLAWKGVLTDPEKANELLLLLENRRAYNLDCVIEQFQEARKSILGGTLHFDDL